MRKDQLPLRTNDLWLPRGNGSQIEWLPMLFWAMPFPRCGRCGSCGSKLEARQGFEGQQHFFLLPSSRIFNADVCTSTSSDEHISLFMVEEHFIWTFCRFTYADLLPSAETARTVEAVTKRKKALSDPASISILSLLIETKAMATMPATWTRSF